MNELNRTLAKGESVNTKLRASELTTGTFAAHVSADVGVLEKVPDATDQEKFWFVPANGSKKLLFDAGKNGALKPMCGLARYLGEIGLLQKISTHPKAEDYQTEEWWLDYANRHSIDPDILRAVSKAVSQAADRRAKQALQDAVKAAGGEESLRKMLSKVV